MTGSGEELPVVYIVSDALGETAELVVRAAASQYDSGRIEMRRVPYVSDPGHLDEIMEEASAFPSIIAYTLVVPELKERLEKLAGEYNIPTVDVLGPMMAIMGKVSHLSPKLEPGLLRQLDDQYYRKVEAVEFAVKYDDGKDPRGLLHADIVLVGVSRTSKTPVSMYLAHKRLKVANVPLVPEVAPPEELFQMAPRKVVGLTIKPELLTEIRTQRLKALGLAANAIYADLKRIATELEYARNIMDRLSCPVIDVSNRAVEETASKVLEIFFKGERHGW